MKLSNECVRDSLLELESKLKFDTSLQPNDLLSFSVCDKYGKEEFLYTLTKLDEAGFISFSHKGVMGDSYYWYAVNSITWEGQQYLDNVRDPKVWSTTKKVLGHFESVSIKFASDVASQVLTNLVKGYM